MMPPELPEHPNVDPDLVALRVQVQRLAGLLQEALEAQRLGETSLSLRLRKIEGELFALRQRLSGWDPVLSGAPPAAETSRQKPGPDRPWTLGRRILKLLRTPHQFFEDSSLPPVRAVGSWVSRLVAGGPGRPPTP